MNHFICTILYLRYRLFQHYNVRLAAILVVVLSNATAHAQWSSSILINPEANQCTAQWWIADLIQNPIYKAKNIGNSSVLYRLSFLKTSNPLPALADSVESVFFLTFRPELKEKISSYRNAIAAYRLGTHLGLAGYLIPTFPVKFDARQLQRALSPAIVNKRVQIDAQNTINGALSTWVSQYILAPYDTIEEKKKWQQWLFKGPLPPQYPDHENAIALSKMLIFDFLINNWDRWSGGNIAIDGSSGRLIFTDHDSAFLSEEFYKTSFRYVAALKFWPADLMARLRLITPQDLEKITGEEYPGKPLISPQIINETYLRLRKLLNQYDSLHSKPPSIT